MWGFLYLEFLWYNCSVDLNFPAIIMIAGRFKRPYKPWLIWRQNYTTQIENCPIVFAYRADSFLQ